MTHRFSKSVPVAGVFRWLGMWSVAISLALGGQDASKGAVSGALDELLVESRDGKALDARRVAAVVPETEALFREPLTIEGWFKLDSKDGFNILLASEPKASASHWELYTYAESGYLSFYLPSIAESEIKSERDICDGKWHFIGVHYAYDRVRLYVDGERVVDRSIDEPLAPDEPVSFAVGRLVEGTLGCDGQIDSLRIRRGLKDLATPWKTPPAADEDTLALWSFDELLDERTIRDHSENGSDLLLVQAGKRADSGRRNEPVRDPRAESQEPAPDKVTGHWGEDRIGFRWTEADSVDDRWQAMDHGPFLSTTVQIGDAHVLKGLVVDLGGERARSACYNTATMNCEATWTDGFLRMDPARYGLIRHPIPDGELQWRVPGQSTWVDASIQYHHLDLLDVGVELVYSVDGITVRERPASLDVADGDGLLRSIQISARKNPVEFQLGVQSLEPDGVARYEGWSWVAMDDSTAIAWRWVSPEQSSAIPLDNGRLRLPASEATGVLQWVVCSKSAIRATLDAATLIDFREARKRDRQWGEPLKTQGAIGESRRGLRMDSIAIPFENPHRALMFLSGIDFLADGTAFVSTVHGDVWRVTGLHDQMDEVLWTRFATGLYQPLGVRIRDERVYVLGKDQLTRLEDRDGNGEADRYICFNNAGDTSVGNHDYAACLETDQAGNFYYVRGNTGVEVVSADGRTHEVIATGLRNPNGMGVSPDDLITVAPQEGEWTPASNIAAIRRDGHYGYRGPQVTPDRPLGYDPPMLWLPRLLDNSSGGQVWLPDTGWGPLNGAMLHLSYGRCWPLLVLPQSLENQWQAGAVKLPFTADSGLCRGRVQPNTKHLFLTGLKGWASAAVQDGCFLRLVPDAKEVPLPIEQSVVSNGIVLKFGTPLDASQAQDATNWYAQQWNYRYAADYGSSDYKVSSPGVQGHDDVEIQSVTLLDDQHTVFVEIQDIQPVMQLALSYQIKTAAGLDVDDTVYFTIHQTEQRRLEPGPHAHANIEGVVRQPRRQDLAPGLLLQWSQQQIDGRQRRDHRVSRFAAFDWESGNLSPWIEGRAVRATWTGWLYTPRNQRVEFSARLEGTAELRVNDQLVPSVGEAASVTWQEVDLRQGFSRFQLTWDSTDEPAQGLRLEWQGEDFQREPVPADRFFHDPENGALRRSMQRRDARILMAESHCHRCHSLPESVELSTTRLPELGMAPPDLINVGRRLRQDWLAEWILDPREHASTAKMPQLLDASDPEARTIASDIAAYLTQGNAKLEESPGEFTEEQIDEGTYLFEAVGCIACHTLEPQPNRERIKLGHVARKFGTAGLIDFLQNPQRHRPAHKMPNFGLTESEAKSLAGYLFSESEARTPSNAGEGDASHGRSKFQSLGCAECHDLGQGRAGTRLAPSMEELIHWDKGCLGGEGGGAGENQIPDGASMPQPRFSFSMEQRKELAQLLRDDIQSLAKHSRLETAERWYQQLRCASCHVRDGQGGDLAEIIFEESLEGASPEALPNLTWVGEKLRAHWVQEFLSEPKKEPLRPWLRARMPAFPFYAEGLARGLPLSHGLGLTEESFVNGPQGVQPELADVGRALISQQQGFDCRQCHAWGVEPATGDPKTQVSLGVNFEDAAERLNYGYYMRWMHDPLRIDPMTKMPRYTEDGQFTKIDTVYDGEAYRQFMAIWMALQQGPTVSSAAKQ